METPEPDPLMPSTYEMGMLRSDFSPADRALVEWARPYTMTSPERMLALVEAVRYVTRRRIPGAIVECGVWRGGSMMLAARTLLEAHAGDRDLYLYDTFEGMPPPGPADLDLTGQAAAGILDARPRAEDDVFWAIGPLQGVRTAMAGTGYDPARLHFVEGRVEDTIPATTPPAIALLRLDTDWYESTLHELSHLYPRLVPGGVLVIDDYGHWQGARRATDEYFAGIESPPLLCRIDYTGRIAVKG